MADLLLVVVKKICKDNTSIFHIASDNNHQLGWDHAIYDSSSPDPTHAILHPLFRKAQ